MVKISAAVETDFSSCSHQTATVSLRTVAARPAAIRPVRNGAEGIELMIASVRVVKTAAPEAEAALLADTLGPVAIGGKAIIGNIAVAMCASKRPTCAVADGDAAFPQTARQIHDPILRGAKLSHRFCVKF